VSSNPGIRIRDLCSKALAATDPGQIELILSELRVALHEKLPIGETWMALCERAAVEQDPKGLLELVSEINPLSEARAKRLAGNNDEKSPGEKSTI
jgi:hypothetical protein